VALPPEGQPAEAPPRGQPHTHTHATPRGHHQLGIGPDAAPKRKKPNREGWAKRLYC